MIVFDEGTKYYMTPKTDVRLHLVASPHWTAISSWFTTSLFSKSHVLFDTYSKPRISRIQVDRQIYPSYAKIWLMRSDIIGFETMVLEILSEICENPTHERFTVHHWEIGAIIYSGYGQPFPASGPNQELSERPRAELCFDFMNRGLRNDFSRYRSMGWLNRYQV